jgi:hypothetical protein
MLNFSVFFVSSDIQDVVITFFVKPVIPPSGGVNYI